MRNAITAAHVLVFLVAVCTGGSTPSDALRYLAIGDSYTIGEGVSREETFPEQLAVLLRARGESVGDPVVIAGTGWTTPVIRQKVLDASPRGPFDLVTVLAGVNDQFRGGSPQTYRNEFEALVGEAIELAGGRHAAVVIVSIPDWSVSPAGQRMNRPNVAAEIDRFNEVNRAVAEDFGTRYVDVTAFSREATDPSMFASDGLHPSAMQYGEWARAILPVARQALSEAQSSSSR
ncbi:MAG: SGNH/GDSL hydrolase family protein [Acidobacteria bacterium]|nr:SGNH/GDSL hydrolase family protein [Acidobacteriota bacterium]